jgi:hypothetical protein
MNATHHKSIYAEVNLFTDDIFGHYWLNPEDREDQMTAEHCQCGLVSSSDCFRQWSSLEYHSESHYTPNKQPKDLKIATFEEASRVSMPPIILDFYESKASMFFSALEASESLSSVGKVLSVI